MAHSPLLRFAARSPLLLSLVALTDEFWSGVAVVAAPEVEREQRIEHGAYALLVFALPLVGSAVIEAGLALVADRYPRRRVTGLALLAMSLALVACALATAGAALAIGLALAGAASGVACAAAQGELVTAAAPGGGARAMTRWVFFGAIGDVLTPVLVALVLSVGGSYRVAFVAAAAVALLQGALLLGGGWRAALSATAAGQWAGAAGASDSEAAPDGAAQGAAVAIAAVPVAAVDGSAAPGSGAPEALGGGIDADGAPRAGSADEADDGRAQNAVRDGAAAFGGLLGRAGAERAARAGAAPADEGSADAEPEEDPEEADALPLRVALREGVRNGPLWRWLVAASLCTFLDEIVVAFAALHAERDLGASSAVAVACVTGASAGAVLGAAVTDRLLGAVAPDRLLFGSTLTTLFTLGAVVLAPSPAWLALALVGLGASAAPQYALVKAKAYAAAPGRPGVVNALAQVFVLVDIAGPLALGALADRWGVVAALVCLAVQPLGILLLSISRRP